MIVPIKNKITMSGSSLHQSVFKEKDTRQLQKYKEYRKFWSESKDRIKKKLALPDKERTLIDKSEKRIQIQPIITNENVNADNLNKIWETSLRDNHKALFKNL